MNIQNSQMSARAYQTYGSLVSPNTRQESLSSELTNIQSNKNRVDKVEISKYAQSQYMDSSQKTIDSTNVSIQRPLNSSAEGIETNSTHSTNPLNKKILNQQKLDQYEAVKQQENIQQIKQHTGSNAQKQAVAAYQTMMNLFG